ncbi:MFS transporter [Sphaerisporangium melleum]|uniref:MFS transporter n=1 Tax=Sphaerisporangium melleum TaxID=321316 RepID=A0A917VP58_9ACTN|nr:MFS transporter [Sphaerisporangium melleum]GGL03629.1 MFS transporter [Sphaerisporangium melleum]GII74038.1 MFS transporter [Sphaerisporangium melleum]
MWTIGVFAYAVAVFHRQSLGVAGIDASLRLGIGPTGLSMLAMLQLLVYAAMQIPVGMLVDRLGSKRMLLIGAAVMACGQLVFALADGLPEAIGGRVLVGGGDAMTFISVIRLVNVTIPARRNPLIVQLTGLLGQLGAIASAVPLIQSLHRYGWTPTFLTAAAIGVLALILVAAVLRDTRPAVPAERPRLREAWAQPGTRLGMWTHAATQSSAAAFMLLWGYPFLVEGQGLRPATAGVLLTALTLIGVAVGPVLGYLAGRHPFHRSRMVLIVICSTAAAWSAVLLWPGRAPLWLLIALVVVLAWNGPGSMIGFDYARTFNPSARIGVATGIVNGGGFTATMSLIALIGIALDLAGGTGLSAYRWAFAVQYPIWAIGAVQVLRYRRKARRLVAELNERLAAEAADPRAESPAGTGAGLTTAT